MPPLGGVYYSGLISRFPRKASPSVSASRRTMDSLAPTPLSSSSWSRSSRCPSATSLPGHAFGGICFFFPSLFPSLSSPAGTSPLTYRAGGGCNPPMASGVPQ
ncbi:hypothetical protein BJX63DRAFT_352935 [Aspergillus granulosus]|uniref:Uncharacterized protein n=1 Tax=Aspergillus granulosus TaxID=176169 RepID=A0ABR4H298_9EURO